jgi:DnaJ-class molecular chaperone
VGERKRAYDEFGSEKLKNGVQEEGNLVGNDFKGNPEFIFENFFGTSNPYT